MFNAASEIFLQTYFIFSAISGKIIDNHSELFNKLFAAFPLSEKDKSSLLALTERDEVREIKTYNDFAQACRIQKYTELSEMTLAIPDDVFEVITVKGNALRKSKQCGFEEYAESTVTETAKLLSETANMGLVISLCALGFFYCEGIFVEKSVELGTKYLERAAKWNNVEGILLALHYCDSKRQLNIDRLYTVTRGTLYAEMYATAADAYGIHDAKILPENKMLKNAFGAGVLKPELYVSQIARFIYSDVISLKDRERALFSGHIEAVAETSDLPLKLRFGELQFDSAAITSLPLSRENEKSDVCNIAMNTDMRGDSTYRPLCINAESDYMLKLYLSAVGKAFSSAHIERIDVSELNEYDFEPTKNNIFVRSCDEDGQNVYLLYFVGEIRESVMSLVKNFLSAERRRKFRLQHPGAVIDLSPVLPICFCDRQNARFLRSCCDMVTLAPVSAAEKSELFLNIFQAKCRQYKMDVIQADAAALRMLAEYSVDRAESIIDRIVKFNRGAKKLIITAAMLQEFSGGGVGASIKYGFGEY